MVTVTGEGGGAGRLGSPRDGKVQMQVQVAIPVPFGYTGHMWNLGFSVLCSAAVAFLLKLSERQGRDRLAVITANYAVAVILSAVMAWMAGAFHFPSPPETGMMAFSLWPPHQPPTPWHSAAWAVGVGLLGGLAYFYGFLVMLKSIQESGVALTGAAAKISVVVPLVIAVLLWGERPAAIQWGGIGLGLVAILLAQAEPEIIGRKVRFAPVLMMLFILIGLGELANKVFQQYGDPGHNALFLLVVFGTAQLLALLHLVRRGRRPGAGDMLLGLAVGVPNMLTSWFLIRSFAQLPAAIAYPVYSAGTILVVALGGAFLFHERLSPRKWVAIGLAAVAVVLMTGSG